MNEMLSDRLNKKIDDIIGKELRGSLNEYLILYLLIQDAEDIEQGDKDKEPGLTTRVLADDLNIPQSTTATVVKRLSEAGLVLHSKGEAVRITEKGSEVGKEMIKHHHLIEILFTNTLDLTPEEAHDEAIRLMLLTSCKLIKSIERTFDIPLVCPRGHKIPDIDLCED